MQNLEQPDQSERTLESWTIDGSNTVLPAGFIFFLILILFISSFVFIFIIAKSTTIVALIIPIVLFLLVMVTLPEFIKSLKAISEPAEIYISERGVYKRNPEKEKEFKLIAWDLMTGYDMKYLESAGILGKIFPRPTKFFIKSKYSDDSFWLDAFGDHVDVLRAYLKEHNVPFGFVQS